MRVFFTLLLLSLLNFALHAQPANDDCGSAEVLSLNSPPGCPSTASVSNNFSFDNIDATPILPYPVFDCEEGSTNGPAAEVWFTFTATGNSTTIEVNGLIQPNVVIYQGSNCVSLVALDCNSGNGNTSVTSGTVIGGEYFILVSGGDLDDQGNFDLEVTSGNACDACAPEGALEITVNPPPINGTFPSGQEVQVCFYVNVWIGDASNTEEWLHSVVFEFGDGWDTNTINPDPPTSCSGNGSWDWYDSWTSCNTGETFGPGFAFDSPSGVGCGGSPNDGLPGNNWGDGQNGCNNIDENDPPFEFCLTIEVGDCPPNSSGDDLAVNAIVYSDGDSGSWTQTGCNTGSNFDITSSVVCCNDDDPLVTVNDPVCAGTNDGSLEIEGNGGFDPDEVFNIYVFDDNGDVVFECLGCSGVVNTGDIFGPGSYTVTAINVASDCPRSVGPFDIFEPVQPEADAQVLNMPCPGDLATLEGSVNPGGGTEIYTWTGPDGTTYMGPTVMVPDAGIYTLEVEVDGCPGIPTTVDVEFVDFSVDIIGPTDVCADTEFQLEATEGVSWEWVDLGAGQNLGDEQTINVVLQTTTTVQVTATDPNGCEAVATIDINVNQLPTIDVDLVSGFGCSNGETVIEASGAGPGGTYEWIDDPGADNPRVLIDPAPGFFTFEVIGTDANGCQEIGSIDIEIVPPPDVTLVFSDDEVCEGEMVTVTAVSNDPISSIDWMGAGPNNQNPITITVDQQTTITADVTNTEGCTAFDVMGTVNIEQAPAAPTIQCGISTATSVEFIWSDVPGATDYEVTIQPTNEFAVVGSPGYTVTGLGANTTVTITVQAIGNDICSVEPATFMCNTLNCPDYQLDIDPVAPICLTPTSPNIFLTFTSGGGPGTITWEDPDVNPTTGEFNVMSAGVGSHTVTIRYNDGTCEYIDTETIVINPTPTSDFSVSTAGPICTDSPVTVTYNGTGGAGATYNWNFGGGTAVPGNGQGPHTVSWPTGGNKTITLTVTENGCTSTQSTQMVAVVAPIATPVVTCGTSTTTSVTFNWSDVVGATSYTVNGPAGTLTGTSYTVNGLMPGEMVTISVTANTSNACGPTTSTDVTCTASNCPNFNVNITPVDDICLTGSNAPITLMATGSGGMGGGTFTWSGPNVTGDQFTPTTAGPQTIMVTYTEGICTASATTTINVFDTPTSNFTLAPANVCRNDEATVTYTGNATAGATYTWNFNGGTATPGNGQGPHTVSWPTGGTKTVTLTVSENGCTSGSSNQTIVVDAPLPAPVINCSPNTTQIVFSWNNIVGAVGYEVNVISAPGGAMTLLDEPNRTFTVTGLMAGDIVEIEVVALSDGPCGNSSNTFQCQAQDCPDITLEIDAVAPICFENGMPAFTLTANVMGGAGNGVFTWNGDGITDMAAGTFDPNVAGVGPAAVTVTYREAGCDYVDDIVIEINAIPTAEFTASSPICISSSSSVLYTGSADMTATYTWDFAGGTADPGTGAGPHTVTWPTAGDQVISLTVTENGCTSPPFTQTITVEPTLIAPSILCDVTGDSIIFTWPAVLGATDYTVTIIDAPGNAFATGGDPTQTFTMAGFTPGQTATIEVTALSGTSCPNITFTGMCALENCPDITVAITDVAPICLDANAGSFDLEAILTGNNNGTLTWSGTGITNPVTGTFDPTATGAGMFQIIANYEETSCFYADTTIITVNAQPSAEFTATSPVCEDEISTITYTGGADPMAVYNWQFDGGTVVSGTGAGPYEVSWPNGSSPTVSLIVTENDCASEPFSLPIEVADSLIAPVITCSSSTTSVTFSWNAVVGADDYQVNVISAPAGATETPDIANRTYTFGNLTAGDMVTIEVVTITSSVCGPVSSTFTCEATPCTVRFFGADTYGPFCADAGTEVLVPVLSGGNLVGTFTWSGDGIVDANGTFDPANANLGDNTVMVTYEEPGCSYDTTYTIVVNPVPVADFTVTSPICITDNSTVTFTGTAGMNAVYTWDFDGGTIVSGSDAGPYEINWPTGGDKNITLTVTENGCTSTEAAGTVSVDEALTAPIISCSSDNISITFSWEEVVGATDYQVNVISVPPGVTETADIANRTYTFTDLIPGDAVVIEVTAIGNTSCGNVTTMQTCATEPCSDRFFGADTYGPFCTDAGTQTLTPVINGGALSGTITWSGDGIVDANGTFDPTTANLGDNVVTLMYEQTECFYDTTYTIVVNPVPVANFSFSSPICITGNSTITFTGTATATAVYNWSFDGGTIVSGSDAGPYEINWATAGSKNVTLSITDNGCVSQEANGIVEVQDVIVPVTITCADATTSSVTFSWEPVAGADTYTVTVIQGPDGTQNGNTYTVDGITDGDEIIIEVTASGNTVCGSSTATGTCNALTCQPLTVSLNGPDVICAGEDASYTIGITGGQGTPVTVDYTVNGETAQLTGIVDGDQIDLTNLMEGTTVIITQVADEINTNCIYPATAEWTVAVDPQVSAGFDSVVDPVCPEDATSIDLNAQLSGADGGGTWTETSGTPSTGGAFQAGAGTFNAVGQNSGTYTFMYTVDGGACSDASATVSFTIEQTPTADAGQSQTLSCNMGMVSIGGDSSNGVTYSWTSDNPDAMITDPTAQFIDVSVPGIYTLEVTNAAGCTDTDQVEVLAEFDVPVGNVSISEVSCFQANDGAIVINNVAGGTPPYTYSLNGGAPTTNPFFGNLDGSEYMLVITDANGCFTELGIMLLEPTEVAVTLTTLQDSTINNQAEIELGESITLVANYDPSIMVDTIIWRPDSLNIDNEGNTVTVTPNETTTYTVTVTDINGCSDSDNMTVIVRKDRPIFVPNAFSPDGDETNDVLYPFGGNEVQRIKSFLVFNRWGEAIFENYDFLPNNPTAGWDGTFRGQPLNAAVFVYFVEVEFIDGSVEIFKGDVMLMR